MLAVAIAARCCDREDALVDSFGRIAPGVGCLPLLLQRHCKCRSCVRRSIGCYGRRKTGSFLLERLFEKPGIGGKESVFGGEGAISPGDSNLCGRKICDLGEKFIAQRCRVTWIEQLNALAFYGAGQPAISALPG